MVWQLGLGKAWYGSQGCVTADKVRYGGVRHVQISCGMADKVGHGEPRFG